VHPIPSRTRRLGHAVFVENRHLPMSHVLPPTPRGAPMNDIACDCCGSDKIVKRVKLRVDRSIWSLCRGCWDTLQDCAQYDDDIKYGIVVVA
jgi:hypothetical protein